MADDTYLYNEQSTLHLILEGKELADVGGWFGSTDPFFMIQTPIPTLSGAVIWQTCYTSEEVPGNLEPRWKKAQVNLQTLCQGNPSKPIRIRVVDWEPSETHNPMGYFDTSVQDLLLVSGDASKTAPLRENGEDFGKLVVRLARIKTPRPDLVLVRRESNNSRRSARSIKFDDTLLDGENSSRDEIMLDKTALWHVTLEGRDLVSVAGWFETPDPYFQVSIPGENPNDGTVIWQTVSRSEHIIDSLNPVWKEVSISLYLLCGGEDNLSKSFRVFVFDNVDGGKPLPMGYFDTSVKEMTNAAANEEEDAKLFTLFDSAGAEFGKIAVLHAQLPDDYSQTSFSSVIDPNENPPVALVDASATTAPKVDDNLPPEAPMVPVPIALETTTNQEHQTSEDKAQLSPRRSSSKSRDNDGSSSSSYHGSSKYERRKSMDSSSQRSKSMDSSSQRSSRRESSKESESRRSSITRRSSSYKPLRMSSSSANNTEERKSQSRSFSKYAHSVKGIRKAFSNSAVPEESRMRKSHSSSSVKEHREERRSSLSQSNFHAATIGAEERPFSSQLEPGPPALSEMDNSLSLDAAASGNPTHQSPLVQPEDELREADLEQSESSNAVHSHDEDEGLRGADGEGQQNDQMQASHANTLQDVAPSSHQPVDAQQSPDSAISRNESPASPQPTQEISKLQEGESDLQPGERDDSGVAPNYAPRIAQDDSEYGCDSGDYVSTAVVAPVFHSQQPPQVPLQEFYGGSAASSDVPFGAIEEISVQSQLSEEEGSHWETLKPENRISDSDQQGNMLEREAADSKGGKHVVPNCNEVTIQSQNPPVPGSTEDGPNEVQEGSQMKAVNTEVSTQPQDTHASTSPEAIPLPSIASGSLADPPMHETTTEMSIQPQYIPAPISPETVPLPSVASSTPEDLPMNVINTKLTTQFQDTHAPASPETVPQPGVAGRFQQGLEVNLTAEEELNTEIFAAKNAVNTDFNSGERLEHAQPPIIDEENRDAYQRDSLNRSLLPQSSGTIEHDVHVDDDTDSVEGRSAQECRNTPLKNDDDVSLGQDWQDDGSGSDSSFDSELSLLFNSRPALPFMPDDALREGSTVHFLVGNPQAPRSGINEINTGDLFHRGGGSTRSNDVAGTEDGPDAHYPQQDTAEELQEGDLPMEEHRLIKDAVADYPLEQSNSQIEAVQEEGSPATQELIIVSQRLEATVSASEKAAGQTISQTERTNSLEVVGATHRRERLQNENSMGLRPPNQALLETQQRVLQNAAPSLSVRHQLIPNIVVPKKQAELATSTAIQLVASKAPFPDGPLPVSGNGSVDDNTNEESSMKLSHLPRSNNISDRPPPTATLSTSVDTRSRQGEATDALLKVQMLPPRILDHGDRRQQNAVDSNTVDKSTPTCAKEVKPTTQLHTPGSDEHKNDTIAILPSIDPVEKHDSPVPKIVLFHMTVVGRDLENMGGWFGSSSCFFEISSWASAPSSSALWQKVYRSEQVPSSLNPEWKEVVLDLDTFCNGDLEKRIQISFFDWQEQEKHVPMGFFETTANLLLETSKDESVAFEMADRERKYGKVNVTDAHITDQKGASDTEPRLPSINHKEPKLLLQLQGRNMIVEKGWFGTPDIRFQLSASVETPEGNQCWQVVYESEYITNSLHPIWALAEINMGLLSSSNPQSLVRLSFCDRGDGEVLNPMGFFDTTVLGLVGSVEAFVATEDGKEYGHIIVKKGVINPPLFAFSLPAEMPPLLPAKHPSPTDLSSSSQGKPPVAVKRPPPQCKPSMPVEPLPLTMAQPLLQLKEPLLLLRPPPPPMAQPLLASRDPQLPVAQLPKPIPASQPPVPQKPLLAPMQAIIPPKQPPLAPTKSALPPKQPPIMKTTSALPISGEARKKMDEASASKDTLRLSLIKSEAEKADLHKLLSDLNVDDDDDATCTVSVDSRRLLDQALLLEKNMEEKDMLLKYSRGLSGKVSSLEENLACRKKLLESESNKVDILVSEKRSLEIEVACSAKQLDYLNGTKQRLEESLIDAKADILSYKRDLGRALKNMTNMEMEYAGIENRAPPASSETVNATSREVQTEDSTTSRGKSDDEVPADNNAETERIAAAEAIALAEAEERAQASAAFLFESQERMAALAVEKGELSQKIVTLEQRLSSIKQESHERIVADSQTRLTSQAENSMLDRKTLEEALAEAEVKAQSYAALMVAEDIKMRTLEHEKNESSRKALNFKRVAEKNLATVQDAKALLAKYKAHRTKQSEQKNALTKALKGAKRSTKSHLKKWTEAQKRLSKLEKSVKSRNQLIDKAKLKLKGLKAEKKNLEENISELTKVGESGDKSKLSLNGEISVITADGLKGNSGGVLQSKIKVLEANFAQATKQQKAAITAKKLYEGFWKDAKEQLMARKFLPELEKDAFKTEPAVNFNKAKAHDATDAIGRQFDKMKGTLSGDSKTAQEELPKLMGKGKDVLVVPPESLVDGKTKAEKLNQKMQRGGKKASTAAGTDSASAEGQTHSRNSGSIGNNKGLRPAGTQKGKSRKQPVQRTSSGKRRRSRSNSADRLKPKPPGKLEPKQQRRPNSSNQRDVRRRPSSMKDSALKNLAPVDLEVTRMHPAQLRRSSHRVERKQATPGNIQEAAKSMLVDQPVKRQPLVSTMPEIDEEEDGEDEDEPSDDEPTDEPKEKKATPKTKRSFFSFGHSKEDALGHEEEPENEVGEHAASGGDLSDNMSGSQRMNGSRRGHMPKTPQSSNSSRSVFSFGAAGKRKMGDSSAKEEEEEADQSGTGGDLSDHMSESRRERRSSKEQKTPKAPKASKSYFSFGFSSKPQVEVTEEEDDGKDENKMIGTAEEGNGAHVDGSRSEKAPKTPKTPKSGTPKSGKKGIFSFGHSKTEEEPPEAEEEDLDPPGQGGQYLSPNLSGVNSAVNQINRPRRRVRRSLQGRNSIRSSASVSTATGSLGSADSSRPRNKDDFKKRRARRPQEGRSSLQYQKQWPSTRNSRSRVRRAASGRALINESAPPLHVQEVPVKKGRPERVAHQKSTGQNDEEGDAPSGRTQSDEDNGKSVEQEGGLAQRRRARRSVSQKSMESEDTIGGASGHSVRCSISAPDTNVGHKHHGPQAIIVNEAATDEKRQARLSRIQTTRSIEEEDDDTDAEEETAQNEEDQDGKEADAAEK